MMRYLAYIYLELLLKQSPSTIGMLGLISILDGCILGEEIGVKQTINHLILGFFSPSRD